MVLFVGLGERMAERFLPIYLLALGGTVITIGLLNGMNNLLNALYSFPGGYLSDLLGYKRALIIFNIIAMVGYLIVIIFPYWQAVIVGAAFFLSWSAISLPACMSMVTKVLPQAKRTMGVSVHSFTRRIPMALGPVLGGVSIGLLGEKNGVRMAFVVAFVLCFISLVMQQFGVEEKREERKTGLSVFKTIKFISPELRTLLVSDVLVRFCEQIPYAFAVVWCMKVVGVSAVQFGVLTAIEMTTAMLVYAPVAYLADKTNKKPFVVTTFVFFTLFPLALMFAKSFKLLIFAFILRGLKEFGEPTRKALILDLAPDDCKASTFGTYYLIRDTIVSLAAFGGAFLWNISASVNFIAAFGFGVAGTLFFAIYGKDLKFRTNA
jgi:MFS family permease